MKEIYLTQNDFNKLLSKEIGHGTDGAVFKYTNEYLIKIYHSSLRKMNNQNSDDSDIKIYDGNVQNNNFCEPINYYYLDVKLRSSNAIDLVIDKQKYIKRTHLPQAPVYIDERFSGYVLKKINGIQIHKLRAMPLKYKLKIIEDVIISVKELLDNYIYHIDLANSPYSLACHINERGKIENVGHSHVLVNPFTLKTNIIDLDGKSTIYTESSKEIYERKTMYGLCVLIIEFLLNVDLKEYEEDFDLLIKHLNNKKIPKQFIESLCYCDLDIKQAENFIKVLNR